MKAQAGPSFVARNRWMTPTQLFGTVNHASFPYFNLGIRRNFHGGGRRIQPVTRSATIGGVGHAKDELAAVYAVRSEG
jgi:hypothetical protein